MSLMRGYGNYKVYNLFDTFKFIYVYLNEDTFLSSFFTNMEFSYMYFNGFNAIEIIINDYSLLSIGSTIY